VDEQRRGADRRVERHGFADDGDVGLADPDRVLGGEHPVDGAGDGGEPGRAGGLEHGHEVGDDDLVRSQRRRGHDEEPVFDLVAVPVVGQGAANSCQVVTTRPA